MHCLRRSLVAALSRLRIETGIEHCLTSWMMGATFCLRRFEEQLAGALQIQLKRGKPGLALSFPGFSF
jgi:hypothetical protein